jgi:hypothetical protein
VTHAGRLDFHEDFAGLGTARSTVVTSRGWPAFQATAARVFICSAPSPGAGESTPPVAGSATTHRTVHDSFSSSESVSAV